MAPGDDGKLLERLRDRARSLASLGATMTGGAIAGIALLPNLKEVSLLLALAAVGLLFAATLIHSYAGNVLFRRTKAAKTGLQTATEHVRAATAFGHVITTAAFVLLFVALLASTIFVGTRSARIQMSEGGLVAIRAQCPLLRNNFLAQIPDIDLGSQTFVEIEVSAKECDGKSGISSIAVPIADVTSVAFLDD